MKGLSTARYQKWKPGGLQEWRDLPSSEKGGENWYRLHEPGSIPTHEIAAHRRSGKRPPFMRDEKPHVRRDVKRTVLERDNYTCRDCGVKTSDMNIVVNYIIPLSQGGTNVATNLYACCRRCKAKKPERTRPVTRPRGTLSSPVVVRLTIDQHARVLAKAYDDKLSTGEVIRRAIDGDGPADAWNLPKPLLAWLNREAKRRSLSLGGTIRAILELVHERALARQARAADVK